MANQTGRPIAPARKLIAAVLGTVAFFVAVFGLGMSSWPVVALGVALIAVAIALGMVNVVRRGARAWVAGSANVNAISDPPMSAAYGRAELQVVVVAPGLPVTEVLVRDPRVPVGKWPRIGDTLPITVDVDDMRRVKINWDEVTDHQDDGDPPPPPSYEPADEYLDDDLLGDPEPPPWATRDRQWGRGPDEPPPPPPPADDLDPQPGQVVVRDTPGGTILEGQLVDADDASAPTLPQRARTAAAGPIPGQSRPASGKPSPRPRAPQPASTTATATVDRAEDQSEAVMAASAPATTDRATADRGTTDQTDPDSPVVPGQRVTAESDFGPDPLIEQEPTAAPDRAAAPGSTTSRKSPTAQDAPTAQAASTAPTEPSEVTDPADHNDIDLPLDGDPEPAPEDQPQAQTAVDSDLIAPPAAAKQAFPMPAGPTRSGPAPATPASPAQVSADPVVPERVSPEPPSPTPVNGAPSAPTPEPLITLGPNSRPAPRTPPTSGVAEPHPAAAAASATAAVPVEAPSAAAAPSEQGRPWADLESGAYEPDDHTEEVITAYPSARPGPAGAIHGVGITVLVTDMDRSIAFYRDTLGFFEIDGGPGSAVLASGDTRLVLRAVHNLSADTGRLIYLNLEVGDVEALYEELRTKGVRFEHGPRPVNRGGKLELWAATFHDPDGHNIAVTQWRAIG